MERIFARIAEGLRSRAIVFTLCMATLACTRRQSDSRNNDKDAATSIASSISCCRKEKKITINDFSCHSDMCIFFIDLSSFADLD